MLSQSCLRGGAKRSAVRQLSLACGGGLRLPPSPRHEETDSGCSDGYSSDSSLSPDGAGGPPGLCFGAPPPQPPSPTPEEDPLRRRTLRLLRDYYGGAKGGKDPALRTLRQVGGQVADKHRMAFGGMLEKLDINSAADLKRVMLASSLTFEDGVTNWGRIVAVISFGALVAQHLKSIHLEDSVETLAENLTDFLMTNKRDWMVAHNEWDGFVDFFHVEDVEGGIRNVLLTLAGFAGVGASLAYMIR